MAVTFNAVTPNLVVRDVAQSLVFYRDVLGFLVKQTVPEAGPYVFVWLERGGVTIFLNDAAVAAKDLPDLTPGTAVTLFIVLDGVDELYDTLKDRTRVLMTPVDQFYGMREFAIADPDGIPIIFAQPIQPR